MRGRAPLFATTMLSGVVGAVFLTMTTAQAAELPVKAFPGQPVQIQGVDGINAKADLYGGVFDDNGIANLRAAVTVPLQGPYGVQIEGSLGSHDNDFLGAIGGHLFWRNPAQGLLGVYASYTHWDRFGGLNATHLAAEGALFLGRWSIEGIAGVESGNNKTHIGSAFITSYNVDTRFFDKINFSYYPQDDLKLLVGHRYLGGKHAVAVGGEWAHPFGAGKMAGLFFEGRIGEDDYRGIWGGLKVYFGQRDKSLIRRHREDAPPIWIPETLFTILNGFNKVPCLPVSDQSDLLVACTVLC